MTFAGAETMKAGIIGLDIFLDTALLCFVLPLVLLPFVPLAPLSSAAMIVMVALDFRTGSVTHDHYQQGPSSGRLRVCR